MPANPTCESDTIAISGCSDEVPRLLYAKVTDVSGCSQFDGKVVQLLYDSVSGIWTSDDADLEISTSIAGSSRSFSAKCVGDFFGCSSFETGSCVTPIDSTFACTLQCCGNVSIHIGELP